MHRYEILFIITVFILNITILNKNAHCSKGQFQIITFGGVGWNIFNRFNVGLGSLLTYKGSIQGLYHITDFISAGIETSLQHQYTSKYNSQSSKEKRSKYSSANYFNTSLIFQAQLTEYMTLFQITFGLYKGIGDNKEFGFGLSSNIAFVWDITDSIDMLIMQRIGVISGHFIFFPVTTNLGVSIKI